MSTAERVRPVFTITRTSRKGGHFQLARFTMTVSTLRGRVFGPYSFAELKRELLIAALLDPATARDVGLAAWTAGTARIEGTISVQSEDRENQL